MLNKILQHSEVVFTGQEAVKVDLIDLPRLTYLLNKRQTERLIDHIVFNCDKEEFLSKLGIEKTGLIINNKFSSFFGVRVYERKYVPLNEVWCCDKDGVIIKKFTI